METITEIHRQDIGMTRTVHDGARSTWTRWPRAEGFRNARMSRWLDRAIATPLFLVLAPIMVVVAAAVALEGGGAVLYEQERLGLGGRRFRIWKFRTMIPDAERDTGPVWSETGDRRVTRVGRFLRSTHLDELPQILNVLRGEMRLVGPRPERPSIAAWLDSEIRGYRSRLAVPPGITGLAQVRAGYDTSLHSVRRKLRYDLFYIRRRSLVLEVSIVVVTIRNLLRLTGEERTR